MSSAVLPLSANEFASRGRASADSPGGPDFTEKKNRENRSINDDVNLNFGFKSLFTLSGWDTKIPVMLQCTVVDALQGWKGGKLENLFQR